MRKASTIALALLVVCMAIIGTFPVATEAAPQPSSFCERPAVLWRFRAGGSFGSYSPFIHEGVLYSACKDGNVYALDPETGKPLWVFNTDDEYLRGIERIGNSLVFGAKGNVYSVDAKTGAQLWVFKTGSRDVGRYGVDAKTGARLWVFKTGSRYVGRVHHAAGKVFVSARDGCVYAVNAETGKEVWRTVMSKWLECRILCIAGNRVIVTSRSVGTKALDCDTGKPEWHSPTIAALFAGPVGSDGKIVAFINLSSVKTLDAATGEVLWSRPTMSGDYIPVVLEGGKLYYVDPASASDAASCVARSAVSGKKLWQFKAGEPTFSHRTQKPAFGRGKVFALLDRLYAIDTSTGKALWKTEMEFLEGLSGPTVVGDVLILGNPDSVVAYDIENGKRLWRLSTGGMVYSRPTAAMGRIYFGCNDAYLYCLGYGRAISSVPKIPTHGPVPLDLRNGRVLIHGRALYATVRANGGLQVGRIDFEQRKMVDTFEIPGASNAWIIPNDRLLAVGPTLPPAEFDPSTGKELRRAQIKAPGLARPVYFDLRGNVVIAMNEPVGRADAWIVGIDVTSGQELWRKPFRPEGPDVLNVAGNTTNLYLHSEKETRPGYRDAGVVTAADLVTGKNRWSRKLDLVASLPGIESDGTLYLACDATALIRCPVYALDTKSGEVRWKVWIEGGKSHVLTLDSKAVYVVSSIAWDTLHALRRKDGKELWRIAGFTWRVFFDPLPRTLDTRPLVLQKDNVTVVGIDRATGQIIAEAVFPELIFRFGASDQIGYVRTSEDEPGRPPGGKVWLVDLGKAHEGGRGAQLPLIP